MRKAARELGMSEIDVRRSLKVASLTPEAKEAAQQLGLDDNRSAMLKAADYPPELQADALREIAKAKSETKKWPNYNALIRAWRESNPDSRREFIENRGSAVRLRKKAGRLNRPTS